MLKLNVFLKECITIELWIKLVALLAFGFAAFVALYYSGQPLLEQHAFRQTQTALTSYWFIKDGFSLAYLTPVGGAPWTIPFEFPLYQYIVSVISMLTGLDLGAVGRVTSFVFLALCVLPAKSICKKLSFDNVVLYFFVAFLFSTPIYLFWGRTFMMETAALFFAVVAIDYFVSFVRTRAKLDAGLFVFFIVLSVLQKATTGFAVLAVMAFVFLFYELHKNSDLFKSITPQNVFWCLVLFAVPLAIGYGWTRYTDIVKVKSEFGTSITSAALSKWNWGTFDQRFSSKLYEDVLWGRVLKDNFSGFVGVLLVFAALFCSRSVILKRAIGVSLVLGLAPFLIFTNLHLIHNYYQSANVLFLVFALALAFGERLQANQQGKGWFFCIFLALMINNYIAFANGYFVNVKDTYTTGNSKDLGIASVLKHSLRSDQAFVAFGNDWSSALSYYSERKSFTVPSWFKGYDAVVKNPSSFLGQAELGGEVICPDARKPHVQHLSILVADPQWKVSEVAGCYVAVQKQQIGLDYPRVDTPDCEGSLDYVGTEGVEVEHAVRVRGWTTVSGKNNVLPDAVYVTLINAAGAISYHDAVQFPRVDVDEYFGVPNLGPSGFGMMIPSLPSGTYHVGIARVVDKHLEFCQFQKALQVGK